MAKAKTTTYEYKTKKIDGRLHMQCQNCNPDSKYYSGTPCDNWVPVSDKNIVSVLCSTCTSNMCRTPQTKKKVAKAAPARKSVRSAKTPVKRKSKKTVS